MRDGSRSAIVRIATWSARHPSRAIAGWVIVVAVCLTVGSSVGTNSGEIKDFWIGEAGRAEAIAATGGLTPPPVEQILITSPAGPLDVRAADAVARDVAEKMRTLPEVANVSDPIRQPDAGGVRLAVTLVGDADTAKQAVPTLLERTAAAQTEHPGLTIAQTGSASISTGIDERLGQDLARAEAISLPITMLILFLVFGAVLAAGIPILLALSAVVGPRCSDRRCDARWRPCWSGWH